MRLGPSAQAWQGIYGFDHVLCVLGPERGPLAVPDRHIAQIKGFGWSPPVLREEQFLAGDGVRVVDGAFDGQQGRVARDGVRGGYIALLVSMFGAETPMRLPLAIVEKIA